MNHRNESVPADDSSPAQVERRIQDLGLTAPRIKLDDLKAEIVSKHFFTAEGGAYSPTAINATGEGLAASIPDNLRLLTFCVLVLRNGFTVTGESACASPENFNAQLGRDIAERNATDKIWSLLGFTLRDTLAGIDRGPHRDPSSRTRGDDWPGNSSEPGKIGN